MVLSFTCRDTQKLFEGKRIGRWVNIESTAMRMPAMLNRALKVFDRSSKPSVARIFKDKE